MQQSQRAFKYIIASRSLRLKYLNNTALLSDLLKNMFTIKDATKNFTNAETSGHVLKNKSRHCDFLQDIFRLLGDNDLCLIWAYCLLNHLLLLIS